MRRVTSTCFAFTRGLKVWISLCTLLFGSQAWAKRANLFMDGFNAAAYGDFAVDRGAWEDENLSLLRVKAGVQIMRIGPVGLTLGYQKNGFYTAQHNWDRQEGSLRVDYRGPVVELHLFPSALLNLTAGASRNEGFLFRKEADPRAYGTVGCEPCDVRLERSRLELTEYTAQLGLRVAPELNVTLGAGRREVTATPAYEVASSDGSTSFYEPESGERSSEAMFYFIGLRGSQL